MKKFNENRSADPADYPNIAAGCVQDFLTLVMKNLWINHWWLDSFHVAVLNAKASINGQLMNLLIVKKTFPLSVLVSSMFSEAWSVMGQHV